MDILIASLIAIVFSFLFLFLGPGDQDHTRKSVSAIYVFGDSLIDTGNLNALLRGSKSYLPFGMDLPRNITPGRDSNAELYTDFISSYLDLGHYVPAFFDQTKSLEDFITGVCFGVGGSGYDPLTAQLGRSVSIQKQMENFVDYKSKLQKKLGRRKAEKHIRNALFVINSGTNDLLANYMYGGIRNKQYTLEAYVQFLLQNANEFFQSLFRLGARRILVAGVAPIGCFPIVITLASNAKNNPNRHCIQKFQTIAQNYDKKLQVEIKSLQGQFKKHNGKISYASLYESMMKPIENPQQFGFQFSNVGCCGTGRSEVGNMCNPSVAICDDRSKYLFFDAIHPTTEFNLVIYNFFRHVIDRLIKT